MLNVPEHEKQWLQEFQKELIQDRIDETGSASPLYYAIHDNKEVVTAEGYEDSAQFYHEESCTAYDTIEDILRELDADEAETWAENYPDALTLTEDGTLLVKDNDACIELLEDQGYTITYLQNVPVIQPGTLFLTRQEAMRHLNSNRHHYTKDAVTYSMTAFRSPQYEHLIELLHQIDWKHTDLKFRIPKNWISEKQIRLLAKAYGIIHHISDENIIAVTYRVIDKAIQKHCSRGTNNSTELWFHPQIENWLIEEIKTTCPNLQTQYFSHIHTAYLPQNIYNHFFNNIPNLTNHAEPYTCILDYYYEAPYHTAQFYVKDKLFHVDLYAKSKQIGHWQGAQLTNQPILIIEHSNIVSDTTHTLYFEPEP